jgi:hypothetical protein
MQLSLEDGKKDEKDEKEKEKEKEELLFQRINLLPDVLIDIVHEFVPLRITVFLSKDLYIHHHHKLKQFIPKVNKESYIRDMIRRDCDFVFSHLVNENFVKWIFEIKHYKYKNIIYKNYLYFIKDFCLIQESTKCRTILQAFFEKHDLCKNQSKKNHVRNIRWKT